jgi:hypothetical protein
VSSPTPTTFLTAASMYTWLNMSAVAGAFFIEQGRAPSWPEIAELDRACRPETHLDSRTPSGGDGKAVRPVALDGKR